MPYQLRKNSLDVYTVLFDEKKFTTITVRKDKLNKSKALRKQNHSWTISSIEYLCWCLSFCIHKTYQTLNLIPKYFRRHLDYIFHLWSNPHEVYIQSLKNCSATHPNHGCVFFVSVFYFKLKYSLQGNVNSYFPTKVKEKKTINAKIWEYMQIPTM